MEFDVKVICKKVDRLINQVCRLQDDQFLIKIWPYIKLFKYEDSKLREIRRLSLNDLPGRVSLLDYNRKSVLTQSYLLPLNSSMTNKFHKVFIVRYK
jgi:hypothetical protein